MVAAGARVVRGAVQRAHLRQAGEDPSGPVAAARARGCAALVCCALCVCVSKIITLKMRVVLCALSYARKWVLPRMSAYVRLK